MGDIATQAGSEAEGFRVLEVRFWRNTYASQNLLALEASLGDPRSGAREEEADVRKEYFVVDTSMYVDVFFNAATRAALEIPHRQVRLFLHEATPVCAIEETLERYFPGSRFAGEFSIFVASEAGGGPLAVKRPPLGARGPFGAYNSLQYQFTEPLFCGLRTCAHFAEKFIKLDAVNSAPIFARRYTISVQGAFIFARAAGRSAVERCIAASQHTGAYRIVKGRRTFVAIEDKSCTDRWVLFTRNEGKAARLLDAVRVAVRNAAAPDRIRDVEYGDAKAARPSVGNYAPRAEAEMDPHAVYRTKSLDEAREVLFERLKTRLQQSIWDSISLEFLVYVLHIVQGDIGQRGPHDPRGDGLAVLLGELRREIRRSAAQRKKFLKELGEK